MRKFVYGSNTIEQSADVSIEDVKSAMTEFFPELENATYTIDEEGTVTFVVRAASKGATRKFVYGSNTIEQSADVSIEDVKSAMTEFFPELENATYTIDEDGTVTFVVRAASKGK